MNLIFKVYFLRLIVSEGRIFMDLKQLEYILKIAEERNITHAAEKLFITQSALNQQLLKLEKELGCKLFYRSRTNCKPTEAGKIYIAAAEEILHIKHDTYQRIFDLEQQYRGRLSIGFTPNRGTAMFSAVYPKFHEKYPQIIVEPIELSVADQLVHIKNHTLDLGFLTLLPTQKQADFCYERIKTEEIFLAIPASLDIGGFFYSSNHRFPLLPLEALKKEAFVLLYKRSTIRTLVDALFHQAGFSPNVLFETSSTYTILNMIEAGLCCGFIPAYYADNKYPNIRYYSLLEHPTWEIVSCYSSHSYMSNAAKDFILLAKEYWNT